MIALARYAEANATTRAIIPRLLKRDDFAAIARCPTIQDAWNALRRTAYGEWLPEESAPTALSIERRLREVTAAWFQTPVRRLHGRAAAVGALLLARWELDHLQFSLRLWHGREAGFEALLAFPLFLHNIAAVELTNARSLDEIADILHATPYAAVLRENAEAYHTTHTLFHTELALERDYYRRLLDAVRALRASDARIGERLVGDEIDAVNLSWVARLHEYYHVPDGGLAGLLIPGPSRLSQQLARPNASFDSIAQPMAGLLARGGAEEAHGAPAAERASLLEHVIDEMAIARARAALGGYPFTIAGVFAFHRLLRAELRNLCCVFAGKRLGVGEQELMNRLRGIG